jgi:hypothetical protein
MFGGQGACLVRQNIFMGLRSLQARGVLKHLLYRVLGFIMVRLIFY